MGTRSCIYILVLLQKQEYILQRDWSCLQKPLPWRVLHFTSNYTLYNYYVTNKETLTLNSRLLCSEFHARMKRVNSKCSSVQLRANSAIYSHHSRLVLTLSIKQIKLDIGLKKLTNQEDSRKKESTSELTNTKKPGNTTVLKTLQPREDLVDVNTLHKAGN